MSADATGGRLEGVRGGLEATGTGIKRLSGLDQGLHNRHLVGLMAANTFLNVTGLMLEATAFLATEGVDYPPAYTCSPGTSRTAPQSTSSAKPET